ncbi:SMC-Scp complex subunit ScpB [Candidatus Kaiserbacteria bacterium]|nr:SMC-Scp complex subunit ScpB [Candidatus Kaiserbacteria bacterium]
MLTPPAAAHALLFAKGGPMDKKQLAKLLEIKDSELPIVLKALTASLKGSGVMLVESGSETELRTAPEASVIVKKLRESELTHDLGKASLETLAVIAYRSGLPGQGTTRGEIDWVRGVNSSTSLRTLLMRGLIEGREDEHDKRRIRYSLTTEALAHLGVARAEDLPRAEELGAAAKVVIDEESVRASATNVPVDEVT